MTVLPKQFFRRPNSKPAIAGFTLTELLVVMVTVFIVAAMFMPLLLSTKEASMLASCTNNLRQIGVGCQIYASANNDYWPTINLPGATANFINTY